MKKILGILVALFVIGSSASAKVYKKFGNNPNIYVVDNAQIQNEYYVPLENDERGPVDILLEFISILQSIPQQAIPNNTDLNSDVAF